MATLQYSTTLRNAQLDAIATTGAGTAKLSIITGSLPANCAAADSGTVLASLTLPATWMGAASGGSVVKAGTWEDTSADAAGTAGHFRLYKNDGTTVVAQGDVTATAGGGAMTVDNVVFAAAQAFTITAFTITAGNA
jgi:hypothetical protein